ncbi:MAG: ATP-binding cassette domain-containing protein [Aquidulcibacter sp.]|jgi:zinc/manganese transport system ATP-binding protein|uniref:metal ABC transporter ATP-binding protein n=1 Tax=Aquidulcibacter sp. TaxID=2052990 RepID=UPI0022CA6830|nr:ATP-binding cassette domain-containing protein [Aquidulcibacter sp.]
MSLILNDLAIGYPNHLVMAGIGGTISAGSAVALIGQNGAGKSTLLRTLAGEQSPVSGSCVWDAPVKRHRSIAWLSQSPSLRPDAPLTVRDLAAMGLWARLGLFGKPCRHDQDRIDQALDMVGLNDLENQPVSTLSGGQLQRALFARLSVQDCGLILLDEPFSAVDAASQTKLLEVIQHWVGEGRTVIAAIHDLDCARQFPLWWELSKFGAILRRSDDKPLSSMSQPLRAVSGVAQSS